MTSRSSTEGTSGAEDGGLAQDLARIAAESQRLIHEFLSRQQSGMGHADPLNIGRAFLEMTTRLMADPTRLAEAQLSLWQQYLDLWQRQAQRLGGEEVAPAIEPESDDRRFRDREWSENAVFDFLKQSYLLTARWLQRTVNQLEGIDAKEKHKLEFFTRQFADALSPTNFLLTNPEVLRETRESHGENLIRGLSNLIDDLERGEGRLAIKMVDPKAFTLGTDLATTPGKVVFRNDLIELIQYAPTTKTVYRRPLLIVPPWINKYYILDLKPENSFVRFALERGFTVFMISWVNPDSHLRDKDFVDYMLEGPLAAIDAIGELTGEKEVNTVGYCIGGTLMAATHAYMAAKKDSRVKAATFFTALVDFTDSGDLSVFIDEEQIKSLEQRMKEKGYLDKDAMHATFNMLRANDLIWSFVVNNYLMGKEPIPFDLLYWNSDSTRMPEAMHRFYLRTMYAENRLSRPGGIELDGVPIDLRKVTLPTYILAAKEDHIAPWKAAFEATRLYRGAIRFVLSASGHVAGVINPPQKKKYGYWTGAIRSESPESWLAAAEKHAGSWWPDWADWLEPHAGERVAARDPAKNKAGRKPICDAPGTYVLYT